MKSHSARIAICAALAGLSLVAPAAKLHHMGHWRVWADSETAGVSLTGPDDHYRSWKLRFCDGHQLKNGRWVAVLLSDQVKMTEGHYWPPRYSYVEFRPVGDGEPAFRPLTTNDLPK